MLTYEDCIWYRDNGMEQFGKSYNYWEPDGLTQTEGFLADLCAAEMVRKGCVYIPPLEEQMKAVNKALEPFKLKKPITGIDDKPDWYGYAWYLGYNMHLEVYEISWQGIVVFPDMPDITDPSPKQAVLKLHKWIKERGE